MKYFSYILLRFSVFLFGLVPFWKLYLLSNWTKFLLYNVVGHRKKVVKENLKLAFPEKKEEERLQISRAFYKNLADVMLETMKGFSLSEATLKKRYRFVNPEIFDEDFKNGQNVLIIGSHYGNWEWGVLAVSLWLKHQVVGVYKKVKNPYIDDYFIKKRSKWGLELVEMKKSGRAFIRRRENPAAFVLIADQSPSDVKNAVVTDFFNQKTLFLPGPGKAAYRFKLPTYMFDIHQVKRGYYEVTFKKLSDGISLKNQEEVTHRFANELEGIIRKKPEFWLWSHRRWKRKVEE